MCLRSRKGAFFMCQSLELSYSSAITGTISTPHALHHTHSLSLRSLSVALSRAVPLPLGNTRPVTKPSTPWLTSQQIQSPRFLLGDQSHSPPIPDPGIERKEHRVDPGSG